jgi:hypothetical protein
MHRIEHLEKFYDLLSRLDAKVGGARSLAQCTGRMNWPMRGVYFFLEPGEFRTDTGNGPRVVRVGTHALHVGGRTKLWSRLSQHRGPVASGGGNHRGSIFRLIVGSALIADQGARFPTWGVGNSATNDVRAGESALEQQVSEVIGAMSFLWLAINDEAGPNSLRGYVERNAIALLSNYSKIPLDPPSPTWLGLRSSRERIRTSGLWNSNHVNETYDPAFLDHLDELVSNMGTV